MTRDPISVKQLYESARRYKNEPCIGTNITGYALEISYRCWAEAAACRPEYHVQLSKSYEHTQTLLDKLKWNLKCEVSLFQESRNIPYNTIKIKWG